MGQFRSGDAWAEGQLRRAEEVLTEARAVSGEGHLLRVGEVRAPSRTVMARQAIFRDSRPPRRGARVWLGSILLAMGHRLLRSTPRPAAPA
jgi:hypothetical protein